MQLLLLLQLGVKTYTAVLEHQRGRNTWLCSLTALVPQDFLQGGVKDEFHILKQSLKYGRDERNQMHGTAMVLEMLDT